MLVKGVGGSHLQSDSVGVGVSKICISNEFPGAAAAAAGLGNRF